MVSLIQKVFNLRLIRNYFILWSIPKRLYPLVIQRSLLCPFDLEKFPVCRKMSQREPSLLTLVFQTENRIRDGHALQKSYLSAGLFCYNGFKAKTAEKKGQEQEK